MNAPIGSPCMCGGTYIAYLRGETRCTRCGTFEEGWTLDASRRPLAPPQPPLKERPDGPHRSNADARSPVQE